MTLRRLLLLVAGVGLVALPGYLAVLHGVDRAPIMTQTATVLPAPGVAPAQGAVASGPRSVSASWIDRMSTRTGIPTAAMRAYATAQLTSPCHVGWTTLAGIGWVESAHGTVGGRSLGDDGQSSTRILGPALDGSGKFAAIPATTLSQQWHSDPRWDHAVGPMQFLPTTWETWGADGDGDGTADPNDLDDAALAAADYLCADGVDLTTGEGWSAAIFSYNHNRHYVEAVRSAAVAYADRAS